MSIDLKEIVSDDGCQVSRRVFADEALYQMEQRHIFAHSWLYLAHESQLREVGDFLSTYMGETPVLVARGQDGEIHVSINSCTHRGVPVCRAEHGNAKSFVCPYHNWSFSVEGSLQAIPQEKKMRCKTDKGRLGLRKVPRIESYRGLIFGSLDEDIESLEQYLGNVRFYLDTYFDRFDGGVEVVGPAHKWLVGANWKVPVENQMGDVGHGPFLHGSLLAGTPAVKELEDYGFNTAPESGHGASVRLFPEEADPAQIAWGMEGINLAVPDPEFSEYLLEVQRRASERIGVGGRIKGLTYGVFPNFNFLWSNSAIRVSHPRSPGQVEYWSWWVVPSSAPDSIKKKLRRNYNLMFGPGGLLEQEDADSWAQQFVGSSISAVDDLPYYYGLGASEESAHGEMPGETGNCYNELYAREFFKRWRRELEKGETRS
ncbi:MAG: Rieske 2Fe-2S domain-containing protein [bacterium]|nr:aromatic ring-hydroxylating dioxygenase subunit alpha [Deltaproteobacteria bacterium]MCP4908836.1 Rieske 2Fe-2S domain-containing protein [bacterium]